MAAVQKNPLGRRAAIVAVAGVLVAALPSRAPAAAGATRIVSLIPAATEMLFSMGAGDRLVAVSTYDHFPAAVERLPRVGALLDPNVERILTMKPDLVILYGTQTELKTELDRAGIPYYSYVLKGLPDISQTIRLLGARVGTPTDADALASRIDKQLAEIRAKTAALPHPRTLLVFGREPGSLRNIDASGGDGFLHDMLETAGGIDVLADVHRQSVEMSSEMVLARAPDVILEIRSPFGATAMTSDLSAWNALASVPAVRNHRVVSLVGEEFSIPGPRVVMATQELADALHPGMR